MQILGESEEILPLSQEAGITPPVLDACLVVEQNRPCRRIDVRGTKDSTYHREISLLLRDGHAGLQGNLRTKRIRTVVEVDEIPVDAVGGERYVRR